MPLWLKMRKKIICTSKKYLKKIIFAPFKQYLALKLLTNVKKPDIDIVLMNIKKPGINGFEATKQIKQLRPDLPIIAQTANVMSEDR